MFEGHIDNQLQRCDLWHEEGTLGLRHICQAGVLLAYYFQYCSCEVAQYCSTTNDDTNIEIHSRNSKRKNKTREKRPSDHCK